MPGNPNPHPAGRFSKTNQPRNRGRKKSLHKQVIHLAKNESGEVLCREDVNRIIQSMMERTTAELVDIYNDPEKPVFIHAIANALLKNFKRGDPAMVKFLLKYI